MIRRSLPKPTSGTRPGVAALECAIALPALLLLLFAILDLGLATMRSNSLAEAARRIARAAVIHGSEAPAIIGTWGPGEFNGTAADGASVVGPAREMLLTMRVEEVSIRVTWPDSGNAPRDRVHVEIKYTHKPLVPGLSSWGPLNLRSFATMRIVN